jgi:hypothetical protein
MKVFPRNTLKLLNEVNGHLFSVHENWIVTITKYGTDCIDKEFYTDLASTPRLIWWLYPPIEFREEGVLHDYLYYKQMWNGKKITRKQADMILRDFVEQRHGKTAAFNFYYAVRLSTKAKTAWNKYKNDRIKNKGAIK